MKLYYAPGACSLAPHIVACEAGLNLDLEKVDLGAHKTESGRDYMTINPKGYVPALEFGAGEVLTEASAVMQYLADQAPGAGLVPAQGTPERYRVLEWIGFISTELHKGFGPLWNPSTPDAVRQATIDRLRQRFAFVEESLAKGPYLAGERFTVADAYAFTILNWTKIHKVSLADYPRIRAFMDRVAARPKVQDALRQEGLLGNAA
ncbi:glutathione transferase GstA [Microvirga massiliensis]|uniref:glutathione transferase GstA n=1 Tax=Microvirga massiliensis TaxID=1033741 RepID=UPI00062B843B|nr:glutathione transferase GstA [Microvirga massiliensis]